MLWFRLPSELRLNHISGPFTAVQLSSRGRRQLSSDSMQSVPAPVAGPSLPGSLAGEAWRSALVGEL